jgi:hypothetical protein
MIFVGPESALLTDVNREPGTQVPALQAVLLINVIVDIVQRDRGVSLDMLPK